MQLGREDIIATDNARVAVITMTAGEISPWHQHTQVTEHVVCLNGTIILQYGKDGESVTLHPGERQIIAPQIKHNLINQDTTPASYLLIQSGQYDFIATEA